MIMSRTAFWLACSVIALAGLGAFAIQQSMKLAELTAALASATVKAASMTAESLAARRALADERKQAGERVARARAKEKAKARVRRAVVAVPAVGILAAASFEEADYRDWRKEHPEPASELDARKQYVEEAVQQTTVVLDEEFEDVFSRYPGARDAVLRRLEALRRKFALSGQGA